MTDRDRLIELLSYFADGYNAENRHIVFDTKVCDVADHLLANGVIVPPCEVGDTVYKLCSVNSNIKMGQMWDGKIVKTNCDRCGYRNCSCYDIGLRELDNPFFVNVIKETTIHNLEFLVKIMPYVGTIYFTDKEQAEKAIKEREGK